MHLKIVNAGKSSFPVAWPNYNTCASYDGINMFRVPTSYDKEKGVLSWKIKPDHVSADARMLHFLIPAKENLPENLYAFNLPPTYELDLYKAISSA